ncbi:MAG TPA: TatD family hydrolase [Clostridia bacterium]|nr:TatD family hydrolase [Clostridia bacterium]
MLFDTHSHYDDDRFNHDRYEAITKVHENGVSYIINAACNVASSVESISLAEKFDFVYAAVGVHPHNVEYMNESTLATIADFASKDKVVAIGEIGLDYFYDTSPREMQKYWFARQIHLSVELGLPIIVHDRNAHEDSLNAIKSEKAKTVGGVFHCFSGSVEMAKILLKNNFYIGVGGSLTFKNAKTAIEVVKYLPLDRLLIETDCPYLTPEPFRGKRNDSGYVKFVAEKVAEIKGVTFESIAEITSNNAKKLFKIE